MQDFSRFVPNVHFEQIPIKNLVSNQECQGPLSPSQVERAITDFDLKQINPVKVSRRNGINYVFNGQHTVEIVATVSGSRETPVWRMIYDSLDYITVFKAVNYSEPVFTTSNAVCPGLSPPFSAMNTGSNITLMKWRLTSCANF